MVVESILLSNCHDGLRMNELDLRVWERQRRRDYGPQSLSTEWPAVKVNWRYRCAFEMNPHEFSRAGRGSLEVKHGLVPEPELVRRSQGIVREDTKQGPGARGWWIEGNGGGLKGTGEAGAGEELARLSVIVQSSTPAADLLQDDSTSSSLKDRPSRTSARGCCDSVPGSHGASYLFGYAVSASAYWSRCDQIAGVTL